LEQAHTRCGAEPGTLLLLLLAAGVGVRVGVLPCCCWHPLHHQTAKTA
jgi:formate hydrogenlyase subunit 3/multisubunit Na+/H+ antiporter MnhD subunit